MENIKIVHKCELCGSELDDIYFFDLILEKSICELCEKELYKEKGKNHISIFKHNYS